MKKKLLVLGTEYVAQVRRRKQTDHESSSAFVVNSLEKLEGIIHKFPNVVVEQVFTQIPFRYDLRSQLSSRERLRMQVLLAVFRSPNQVKGGPENRSCLSIQLLCGQVNTSLEEIKKEKRKEGSEGDGQRSRSRTGQMGQTSCKK